MENAVLASAQLEQYSFTPPSRMCTSLMRGLQHLLGINATYRRDAFERASDHETAARHSVRANTTRQSIASVYSQPAVRGARRMLVSVPSVRKLENGCKEPCLQSERENISERTANAVRTAWRGTLK